jgi:hypothetical protein
VRVSDVSVFACATASGAPKSAALDHVRRLIETAEERDNNGKVEQRGDRLDRAWRAIGAPSRVRRLQAFAGSCNLLAAVSAAFGVPCFSPAATVSRQLPRHWPVFSRLQASMRAEAGRTDEPMRWRARIQLCECRVTPLRPHRIRPLRLPRQPTRPPHQTSGPADAHTGRSDRGAGTAGGCGRAAVGRHTVIDRTRNRRKQRRQSSGRWSRGTAGMPGVLGPRNAHDQGRMEGCLPGFHQAAREHQPRRDDAEAGEVAAAYLRSALSGTAVPSR